MNKNKLFLDDIKFIVESRFPFNEFVVEQLVQKYDKNSSLLYYIYNLFQENRHLLPLIDDIELIVYDYIIKQELTKNKTLYGAILYAADLFDATPTYVKCKLNYYRENALH